MTYDQSAYQANGFAVAALFDPQQVRDARRDIAEHIDRVSRALYLPFAASCPEEPLETRFQRIWQHDRSHANLLRLAVCTDAHRGEQLQALVNSPELKEAAEQLAMQRLGRSVVRIRASIDVFPQHLHDWHSDVARNDGTDCGSVRITAWIPLGDAGPGNGGLELVPGQRASPLPHSEERGFVIPEAELAELPKLRPSFPAGSVLFLDRFTPHRSLPAGSEARFALVVWMKAA